MVFVKVNQDEEDVKKDNKTALGYTSNTTWHDGSTSFSNPVFDLSDTQDMVDHSFEVTDMLGQNENKQTILRRNPMLTGNCAGSKTESEKPHTTSMDCSEQQLIVNSTSPKSYQSIP